ncbi:flavodoxin/nitric oxide synthase (plasmid) [Haloterrigena turkmenica DSM 5511]|uniref:Flavodoxin/nitric oxide synthase n=1 Tax=Haloterrigena turkmenica (strain ATCC 51198 / DSM 5511 / JCM 9101 / NCIMB 13204 / VKM B-1734 / 4k) TaxID=543526 RepID=D2S127_HALTV|nr:flavodoxin domain-containing protein [Haloterrigena turkmenica]ADB63074.1 flavodoxin/nitric oxide synthase [Haloterrigena turkmenica DSM 5511]
MVSFLVLYGSGEGQTETVAARIAETLDERGHDATTLDVDDLPATFDLNEFDAVLVGASIHAGKHQSSILEFVRSNRPALDTIPTAFFQVSLSSATEVGRAQAAGYFEEFVAETEWHPNRVGFFGGALRYSEYGFLKRLLMKQIAKRTISDLPEADASGDVEFTDWKEVEAFAADVAAFVEGRLGVAPPGANGRTELE